RKGALKRARAAPQRQAGLERGGETDDAGEPDHGDERNVAAKPPRHEGAQPIEDAHRNGHFSHGDQISRHKAALKLPNINRWNVSCSPNVSPGLPDDFQGGTWKSRSTPRCC